MTTLELTPETRKPTCDEILLPSLGGFSTAAISENKSEPKWTDVTIRDLMMFLLKLWLAVAILAVVPLALLRILMWVFRN